MSLHVLYGCRLYVGSSIFGVQLLLSVVCWGDGVGMSGVVCDC